MVLEQVLHNYSSEENTVSIEKWKSLSTSISPHEENPTCGFDCNICLDLVHEPVVTLCGHLYCWPCIHKWIHLQSISKDDNLDPQKSTQCPVCKSEVSQLTIIPLYGRGQSTKPSEGKDSPHLGIVVPRRPHSPTCGSRLPLRLHHRRDLQRAPPVLSLGGTTMPTDVFHPVLGETVYARVFENPETVLYNNPYSYRLAGSNSPRVRRHIMETDKSLSRVSFFLCCCLVVCLLLF